jgi:hypothetical protein
VGWQVTLRTAAGNSGGRTSCRRADAPILRRFTGVTFRERHNSGVTAIFSIIGVTCAVLLAFVAMLTGEGFNRARAAAFEEAGAADDITTPEQVLRTVKYLGTSKGRVVQETTPCGHIGLFMGARTLEEHWPPIARWIAAQRERIDGPGRPPAQPPGVPQCSASAAAMASTSPSSIGAPNTFLILSTSAFQVANGRVGCSSTKIDEWHAMQFWLSRSAALPANIGSSVGRSTCCAKGP